METVSQEHIDQLVEQYKIQAVCALVDYLFTTSVQIEREVDFLIQERDKEIENLNENRRIYNEKIKSYIVEARESFIKSTQIAFYGSAIACGVVLYQAWLGFGFGVFLFISYLCFCCCFLLSIFQWWKIGKQFPLVRPLPLSNKEEIKAEVRHRMIIEYLKNEKLCENIMAAYAEGEFRFEIAPKGSSP